MGYGGHSSKTVVKVYPGFGECTSCSKTTLVTREVKDGGYTKVEVYCSNCGFSKNIS